MRGFYISYDRQYSYVGVRGFSNPGDYNTRVLLMVDGHRLNDAIYEQAMVGTEFSVDVDLIERVEIIRGPASSLYGTNAVFAVINVITRTASEIHGEELEGDAGSFNTYRGRMTYGDRLGELTPSSPPHFTAAKVKTGSTILNSTAQRPTSASPVTTMMIRASICLRRYPIAVFGFRRHTTHAKKVILPDLMGMPSMIRGTVRRTHMDTSI